MSNKRKWSTDEKLGAGVVGFVAFVFVLALAALGFGAWVVVQLVQWVVSH